MHLPPFLTRLSDQPSQGLYVNCEFKHEDPLGKAHCLWWSADLPTAIVLFIPGNPGLVDFYVPFLSHLHRTRKDLAILAHAHINHTPGFRSPRAKQILAVQAKAATEVLDALRKTYPALPVIIISHSVGAYITLQVLKARESEVRLALLICPTISNIAHTPNGKRLSWLFRPPLPLLITALSPIIRLLPGAFISTLFSEWPPAQMAVLSTFLNSPYSIFAALSMAHDEMKNIQALDTELLRRHQHDIRIFFTSVDHWVGEQEDVIRQFFEEFEPGSVKITRGIDGIPHAFCINHGEEVATQCAQWIATHDFSLH
ncbi:hypothetical protein E1B28_013425 [Marasmius oreades]|uniref:Lipid droplet-associated hydrolase n=1 Tax=Marasmius oreades TaxID=181124 RepID=A0A9P7RPR8_9AGAR|nr:uncharacterized protein E1B28_013425 [Marasmius oreades]KAG7087459.1 hypothetical protein E1B28_013425 [Marasmius oreades]